MPTDAAPAQTVQAARPAISVAGRVEAELAAGLLELRVAEDVEGLTACELTVGNWGANGGQTDFLYFDRAKLDFGKALRVAVGGEPVFEGRITGLEASYPPGGGAALTVLAEDRFQDLRMTRRTRTFADASDADVCRRVAGEHGLQPDVSVPGGTHAVLAQLNQTDLAFLRDRCRTVGAELWVEGERLRARPRPDRGGARVKLGYGRNLREFSALADLAHQRTRLAVTGWDVAGKAGLREEAGGAAISGELGDGQSGPQVLAAALGERVETVAGGAPLTSAEARSRAEAAFRSRARRFVTGRGSADPDARLRVGATVELEGLGPLFSGAFSVTEVVHRFDGERGLRTDFAVERPALGTAA
jgi:phage protein D